VTAGFWNNHVHILTPTLVHVHDSGARELDEQLDTMFNRWASRASLISPQCLTTLLRPLHSHGRQAVWTIEPVLGFPG
jgi:hypothetical protein